MRVRYVRTPEQYKDFVDGRELLIGAWAESLVPVLGEMNVKFMRIDTPNTEILIVRKSEGERRLFDA